jgi:outer membrane protein OmpA-like peptidoglycan-associated protein
MMNQPDGESTKSSDETTSVHEGTFVRLDAMQLASARKTLAVCAAALAFSAVSAVAQPRATLDRFRSAPTPEDDFHVSRATDLGHLRFGAQLTADYALDPLVYEATVGDSSSERFSVVEHQLTLNLGLSLGLFDRLIIFAGLAGIPWMEGTDDPLLSSLGVAPADGPGLGDASAGARVRLFGEATDAFALALQANVTFPTSGVPDDSSYRGEPTVTFLPSLIAELRPGAGSRLVLDVGARIREESDTDLANLGFGHELTYALGFAIPLFTDVDDRTHLDLLLQIYGETAFERFGEREGTALEATGGFKFFHSSGLVFGLAAGPGLARGFGSPDLRAIATLAWMTPRDAQQGDRDLDGVLDGTDPCPDDPEDVDRYEDGDGCPEPDNDNDGILDYDDECPLEPETANGHEDEDGCPDQIPDTDGDGILDNADQCVDQAEDLDSFQDSDGCPEADNDGDGIVDGSDRCPLEAGPPENRGCPDTDRDTDTVVDRLDNCPDEPGTPEFHGCRERQRVVIEANRLQILEMVFFRTNSDGILSRSNALLMDVARVLNAHPQIGRVMVEGHTDSRGNREHNIELSQRRAESVVRFLVERGGVDASRLDARGYGPDRPQIPDARSRADLARNRRVEFHVLGDSDGVQTQSESEASPDAIDR